MDDLLLLRNYEPIARFTKGEMFFPIAVDGYLKECSLWQTNTRGEDQLLVAHGRLNRQHLLEFMEIPAGHTQHLRLVAKPLQGLDYQRWRLDPQHERFVAPGRLVRVPLLFRLLDSLLNLSLIIRGQVPGGLAAAADMKNRKISAHDPRRVYYGRVTRSGGWIALQYLFFYAMNNWRSGFFGVNDHEADWEQIFVFLTDPDKGEPQPQWVAYASHDFKGDDLRRRWDDPLLLREGNHPVIFAGAGSHASYFEPGEYLMGVEPEFLYPLKAGLNWLRKFWNETLGMGSSNNLQDSHATLSAPFIDYARGDGLSIGPGQEEAWEPELITEADQWAHDYRGLWGLDTRDPIGGERAPAGPKYNRDGSIRQSWYDPIGWAGLDKVFPSHLLPLRTKEQIAALGQELADLDSEIRKKRADLRRQALEVEALKTANSVRALHDKEILRLDTAQAALQALQAQRGELVETRLALRSYARRVDRGDLGPPDAHLHHIHHPEPSLPPKHRVVEIWAAFSGALIILGLVLLLIFRPQNWLYWVVGLAAGLGAVEALTRNNLVNYLLNIIIVLALIASIILLIEFWLWFLIAGLLLLALYMIRGNLRELRR
ncbi:MAG: NPP1 family protein [Candidatus Promineifilaceae bacterium]|nr:NPP1 family protein [Candidatus Promineifilaceae bacterium]